MLKFWGRGSGFTDNHTSAFFVENNEPYYDRLLDYGICKDN